jgi:hypothetical protein
MTQPPHHHLPTVEQRFCFAAWPQAYAHASWLNALDAAVGLQGSRRADRQSGAAEQAVAKALLVQVGQAGVDVLDGVAIDRVPSWAMQRHAPMRRLLSMVAGLVVLPALQRVVGGEQSRHWDAVLGLQVRQDLLRMGRADGRADGCTDKQLALPSSVMSLVQLALAAAKTTPEWDRFCLQLGLSALAQVGVAVQARVRLAWPDAMRGTQSLAVDEAAHAWLVYACAAVEKWLALNAPAAKGGAA